MLTILHITSIITALLCISPPGVPFSSYLHVQILPVTQDPIQRLLKKKKAFLKKSLPPQKLLQHSIYIALIALASLFSID